ncbi:MAG: hypothetical protein LBB94_05125 [Clostridiales bacterium]|nr:hypothetical protein [Clostridiales bacterium]
MDSFYAAAYFERGKAYQAKGDMTMAASDYNQTARLDKSMRKGFLEMVNKQQSGGGMRSEQLGMRNERRTGNGKQVAIYSAAIYSNKFSGL